MISKRCIAQVTFTGMNLPTTPHLLPLADVQAHLAQDQDLRTVRVVEPHLPRLIATPWRFRPKQWGHMGVSPPKKGLLCYSNDNEDPIQQPTSKDSGVDIILQLAPKVGQISKNQTSHGQKIGLLQADTAISKVSNFPVRLNGIDLGALVDQAEDLLGRHDPGGAVREVHGHDAHEHHPEDHLRWRCHNVCCSGLGVGFRHLMFVALCEPPGTKVDLATAETKKKNSTDS